MLRNVFIFQTEAYMSFTARANFYVKELNYLVSSIPYLFFIL